MRAGHFLTALGLLAACTGAPAVQAPSAADFSAEAQPGSAPPALPREACWGQDILPAVIQTETETRLISAEKRDAAGQLIAPARYASESRQRILRERQEVWVRTPCRDQLTPETVLILQRALRARGYYLGPLDGTLSADSLTAIRRYQADGGLDTQVLSLKAAQSLGLVATPLK